MAAIFTIRRGIGTISGSLAQGELYLNNATGSIQFGSGSHPTIPGASNPITLLPLNAPITGDIKLIGDITASNMFVSGNLHVSGNLFLGNQSTDTITATGEFQSNLIPNPHKTYDLGTDNKWWKNIYVNTVSASFISGSIAGIGNINDFSTSVDIRLDALESSASLYDNAMSGSKRLYVSPSGSDSNDGSDPSVPFKTIKAAVESLGDAVFTNTKRYTIFVGSGEYVEQNPIVVPPGVAIVGDTLRTVRLYAANPTKDYFHVHDSNYFYGLRFLDLQHPAFCFSFPASTAKATISGGSITNISVVHSMSGYTDGNNQDIGIIIEGPDNSGSIATATANIAGGVITQINVTHGGTNYGTTEKPHISIPAPVSKRPVITTSPYIQNCSSITGPYNTSGVKVVQSLPYDEVALNIDEQGAGGGLRIDGNLVHPASPLESFVADAFTQVNQGGPGHLVINKGYTQFVSCFTTFCTYGFKTANGGFANISNSVIDFGKYGLISKTYFPTTYNTGSSLETKTSTVSGFVIDENGAGYTGSVASVLISGGGASVQATAEATVNANGSIDEIVLLTAGSGYTSQPTVTIAAPTGPGAIQATTVANKALISGVSEILMSLESGSRGIDISSNMILNGVDYLVTDVIEVSGQPNQRRITTYPAPPSVQTNDQIKFHQLSNISTGGLVMEYVGSGVTYNALPKYGGVPIRTREIIEFAPGRVFYSTVDNIGNLKIGDFFAVNQLTGEVTIDANSFNLSGLNAIGPFKRNGVAVGVVLQEVSNNTTLLNSQGLYGEDTVPTQFAVKGYIDPISSSLDSRLQLVEATASYLNTTFSTSVDSRLDFVEATASYLNTTFSTSVDSRLDVLETSANSDDVRLDNLELYTQSLNAAIELTGSTVSFLGDIVVYGTQSVINSVNLEVADNIIYLNATSSTTNVDLGIIGNYNDGTYAHTGIYRDSSDGVWRVFKGYQPEISGNVDLSETTFKYADFYANEISASSLIGIGNVTLYSTSVDARLDIVEASASLHIPFSQSVDLRLDGLEATASYLDNAFSTSVDSRLDNLESFSGSVNTKLSTLSTYTSSINIKWNTLEIVTSSILQFTGSQNTKNSTLGIWTGSTDVRLTNLESTSQSVNAHIVDINNWTSSINQKNDTLSIVTSSLNNWTGSTFQTFSQSVDNRLDLVESTSSYLNTTFSTSVDSRLDAIEIQTASFLSFTRSIFEPFSTSVDGRLDYVEYMVTILDPGNIGDSLVAINNFTQSANSRLQQLESDSGSQDSRLDNLESFTASLDVTYVTQIELAAATGALENRIATKLNTSSFNSFTQSYNTDSASFDFRLDGLEVFTSSINTTIKNQLNANTVISGSSQVTGLQNSQLVNSSITIAGTSVSLGGSITLATITGGSGIISGSNQLGGIYETTGRGIVSGSSQIVPLLPTGVVSGSAQINLGSAAGNITLATQTTGDYVASLVAGTGVTITNNSGENATPTIAIGQAVATSSDVRFASIGVNTNATGVAGEIVATGDIVAFYSSDERLKENINPIQNALQKVEAISGNTFDWKEGFETIHSHKGNDVGVIAQEVKSILPEIVTERETGYLAVDYTKLVPVLIEAIKELSAKVKELESK